MTGEATITESRLRWGTYSSRHRLTSASAVLIGTTALINLLRIANTMVLTRLLTPSAFGLIGIILSVFLVINMLTDAGFQAFIVRHRRGLEPTFLDAVWTVHVARAFFNTMVAMALAWPTSRLVSKPELAPLMVVASLTLAVDGCASLSLLTSLRQGLVRRLSVVDLAAFLSQMITGIVGAWLLRSPWAIVLSMFAGSATRLLASYLVFHDSRRRFRVDREVIDELWRFSRLIAASSVLSLVIGQIDKLVFARIMPLADFGVYVVAANLAAAPVALAGMYASRIIYPSVADVWRVSPDDLRRHFYAIRGPVFYGYILAAGALGGGARLVVSILYDHRYERAALFLQLLSVTTAMAMLVKPANEVLVASGRVRTTLEVNIVRMFWLAVTIPLALMKVGLIGGIAALASVEIPAYLYSIACLRRFGLFDARADVTAFATIGIGVALGFASNILASGMLK